MALPPGFRITSEMLWEGALVFAMSDAGLVPLSAWRIKPVELCQLRRSLVTTTAMFWGALWAWALSHSWVSVYTYIFPDWTRWFMPVAYGLLLAGAGLVISWLVLHFPGNPVVSFCLLGGLWGMITHLWAVHLGLVERPPMLRGVGRRLGSVTGGTPP